MTALSLVGLLIFASCLATVSSLRCYKCVHENEPEALQHCAFNSSALGNNTEVTCSSGRGENRCTIVKTILKDGSVTTFRRSCVPVGECPETPCTKPDADGTVVCTSCCEGDLCNKGNGPTPAGLSGASRLILMRGFYMFGAFLVCFLCKVIIA